MKQTRLLILILILGVSVQLTASAATPPSGGNFVLVKSTIDGGGNRSTGGNFVLTGTIGQHDASSTDSSGGDFKLAGGFWAMVRQLSEIIFEDGFESVD